MMESVQLVLMLTMIFSLFGWGYCLGRLEGQCKIIKEISEDKE